MRVALFVTCLTDAFLPRAGIAVVKVLEHLGHTVSFPAAQTCCGQPMHNNGFAREATALARRMIRVFEGHETIVTPSGSCAAMIREHYPALFPAGTPDRTAAEALAGRTWEFAEFLTHVAPVDLRDLGVRGSGLVTCHDSCHLRGLGLAGASATLLRQIEGVEERPLDGAEQCCGFGGAFSTKYPQISGAMARDKVAAIRATGADTVVSNDAGCTMNIAGACHRAGCPVRFRSLAEVIAEGLGLLDREAPG